MNNTKLKAINVANAKIPPSRFPWSFDNHTTADFGSVQPVQCKLCVPNSKVNFNFKHVLRAAPMVAPTMGRCRLKTWSSFVPISDLTRNFAPMLAQQPVTRPSGSVLWQKVPLIPNRYISALCHIGAKCSMYIEDKVHSTLYGKAWYLPTFESVQDYEDWVDDNEHLVRAIASMFTSTTFNGFDNLVKDRVFLNIGNFFGSVGVANSNISDNIIVPLNNGYSTHSYGVDLVENVPFDFFDFGPEARKILDSSTEVYDLVPVPLDKADSVVEVDLQYTYVEDETEKTDSFHVALAFRFSSFGKRLRKLHVGVGNQFNLRTQAGVSILPYCAVYKSYFDAFGLTLYDNWENTPCYQLLQVLDNVSDPTAALQACFYDASSAAFAPFWSFIRSIGNLWVTDDADYVSAHMMSDSVSCSASGVLEKFIDVDETFSSIYSPANELSDTITGHAFLTDSIHGALDSELLKRLYRWTNRNTIAGRKIEALLRAQGLGSYVDNCKSNFIGYTDDLVDFSAVVSQSDTFQSTDSGSSGSQLGEYAGFGISGNQSKNFGYETNEFGYIITLCAVVPDSGYCQQFDPMNFAGDKFDFYTPEFDALGMQLDRKLNVCGEQIWSDSDYYDASEIDTLDAGFGYIPRFTEFKVNQNKFNGDFSLPSTRDGYAPFTLDKIIDVNSHSIVPLDDDEDISGKRFFTRSSFIPMMLPIAGNVWRYNSRYPFLSLFNRIFSDSGNEYLAKARFTHIVQNYEDYEFLLNDYDNWLLHLIFDVQYSAPMLPVESSFGTADDEAHANASQVKA